jgi:nucleoside-diphosphate-sugar epimerase
MKAFVTGGTGFVGSHLVNALSASGAYSEIRCLVRSKEKWLQGETYTRINGDLFDLQQINKALEDVDIIFHVAGVTKSPKQSTFTRANVEATEHLLRVAQKKGINNIVVLSSLAAVGPSNGTPLTEEAKLLPVSMYGQSKKEMEEILSECAQPENSIKIIRPPAVYGPREADIYTFFKTFQFGFCPMVGDGNNPKLSMVYVADLVHGIIKAAENTSPGVHTYFMGGEKEAYSWNEIREITRKITGLNPITIKLKPGWIKKIAPILEKGASIFGKYPVVNSEKATEMVEEWVCSSTKAEKELGYQPATSLKDGISATIRWYKNHNWL